jgi:pimeloyl-ACP methyl ester carboxylesterase
MALPTLVLLHSPLMGPASLAPTAAAIAARGARAAAPAWPRLSTLDGDFYAGLTAAMADALAAAEDDPVLLVAHSGAGPLAPALAARLGAAVAGEIFLDALPPHPGRSWFDTAPAEMRDQLRAGAPMGQLPPWDDWWPPGALERLVEDPTLRDALVAELDPLPLGYFEEAAPSDALSAPAAYLQLSGAYEDAAQAAGRQGWPVVRLPLNHLAPLTRPQPVAGALISLAERLQNPDHV